MKLLLAAVFALAVCVSSERALAQGNYRSTPIGGRSALMGGTGIALARDGSAPFLNPATITRIEDSSVAFSVNFYSFTNTHFTSFHQPGAVDAARFGQLALTDTSLDQGRFDALPSTLCLFLQVGAEKPTRKGRQKLAACLGSLERQELTLSAIGFHGASAGLSANQAQSFTKKWNRIHVGPTYSLYLTDSLALGFSLHGINTTLTSQWSASSVTVGADGHAISSGLDAAGNAHSIDLGGIVGVTYHVDRHYTLGLSAQTPVIHVTGGYDSTLHTQFSGAGQYVSLATATGDLSAPPPVRIGAGLGAEYGRLRLEADATYYFPRTDASRAELHVLENTVKDGAAASRAYDATFTERSEAVVNSAFGFEYLASRSISLLGGISTDFSAVPLLAPQPGLGSVAWSRNHRVAASFGLGSYGTGGELLFGTEVSYGWGRAFVVNSYVLPNELAKVEQSTVKVLLVIAGSTSLSTIRRTVTDLGATVTK